jgi:hypothetical protein
MTKNAMTWTRALFVAIAMVSLSVAGARAGRTTVLVDNTDFSTHEAADTSYGDFYTVTIDVPDEAKPIGRVYLEFFVDVSARAVDGFVNDTPVIEIYALTGNLTGTLDSSKFADQPLRMVKNVAVGTNRRVVIDITEMAKFFVANPLSNYGIVIGSLTRHRDGLFTVRSDAFGGNNMCRITFLK